VKARRVKGIDPQGTLADGAERIVRTRLDELAGFWPQVSDPAEVRALHDMRIAAKRLRYVLEVTHHCFGPYAGQAVKTIKELQDLLGEIHDCDVQIPDVAEILAARMAADAEAVTGAAKGDDIGPADLQNAPHRAEYAGMTALLVALQARRAHLFDRFVEAWRETERKGFRARLEYAMQERA
jgi:CHAD domain-containing protein